MHIPDLLPILSIVFAVLHFHFELTIMSQMNNDSQVSSGDETGTSLTVVQGLPMTQMTEDESIMTEQGETTVEDVAVEMPLQDVLPMGENYTVNMLNKLFDPWESDVDIPKMMKLFEELTPEEKQFVKIAHDEFMAEVTKRYNALFPDAVDAKDDKDAKDSKSAKDVKTKHDRFDDTNIRVTVVYGKETKTLTVGRNSRFGTLRQAIAKAFGLKTNQHLIFTLLNGEQFPQHPKKNCPPNANSFLYTYGVVDNSTVTVELKPSEAAPAPKSSASASQDGYRTLTAPHLPADVNDEEDKQDGDDDESESDEGSSSKETDN